MATWVVDAQPILYPVGHALSTVCGQKNIETWLLPPQKEEGAVPQLLKESLKVSYRDPAQLVNTQSSPTNELVDTVPSLQVQPGWAGKPAGSRLYSFSLKGLRASLEQDKAVVIDITPIGKGGQQSFVVYDKPIIGDDVCVRGRRGKDSLYNLRKQDWNTVTHGSCQTPLPETSSAPSLERYLAAIGQFPLAPNHSLLFNLHNSLTNTVHCGAIHELVDDTKVHAGKAKTAYITDSESILGCLQSYPKTIDFGYQTPFYQSGGAMTEAVDHTLLSFDEWKRIKQLEKGEAQGLEHLPKDYLHQLFANHSRMGFLLVDQYHDSYSIRELAQRRNVRLSTYDNNNINWLLPVE